MKTSLKAKIVLLALVLLLGVFFRFYHLTFFPIQLSHDEITQLYDAISIAQTGKDIYGNFMPLIFPSVHDFKPPFYTYITSLFYITLGNYEVLIRIPGAIFGSLIVLAVYLLTNQLFKSWQLAILASLFVAISPSEIFFSRKSFENGAGIFLMTIGFYLLLKYIFKKEGKYIYFGYFLLAAAMYTYFSHAVIIPLLLVIFLIIYRNLFWDLTRKKEIFLSMALFLTASLPLFYIILSNPDTRYRSQTVFITQDRFLGEKKSLGDTLNPTFKDVYDAKTFIEYSINRYLEQFSPDYIFATGLDFTNQGLLEVGPLLIIEFPFLIYGIYILVRKRNFTKEKMFISSWILIGMLPSGLTFEPNSPHRSVMVFTMLSVIAALGFFEFVKRVFNKKRNLKIVVVVTGVVLFMGNFLYFAHMYFINFPYEKSEYIQYPFKEVSLFAWENYSRYDQIIFDPYFGESAPFVGTGAHYYLGYYGNYPPEKMQKEYRVGEGRRESRFDKFVIRAIDFGVDKQLKNTLLIASPWVVPLDKIDKGDVIKTFYFYDRKTAFYAISLKP